MKPTVIIWLIISGFILFAAATFFTYSVTNSTLWTGMNAPIWEKGAIMVAIPLAMIGFAIYLALQVLKGPPDRFRMGGPEQ